MLIYGSGGVGKSTFGSTAPNPILADCENGAKYFGLRSIAMDIALIEKWSDMKEFATLAASDKYQTVVIDPIGELMEKLKAFMIGQNDAKLVQRDGSPTAAGWGWLKQTLRAYLKIMRDSGKHVILVAHVDEKPDEQRLVKRPQVQTKLSDEIMNMVDIVGYMEVVNRGEESKRVIYVQKTDSFEAKDRTGQLGNMVPPDFGLILKAVHGTEKFLWSSANAKIDTQESVDPIVEALPYENPHEEVGYVKEEEAIVFPETSEPAEKGPMARAMDKINQQKAENSQYDKHDGQNGERQTVGADLF